MRASAARGPVRVALVGQSGFGHPAPLLRVEIDHAVGGAPRRRPPGPQQREQEQAQPRYIRNKARNQQKNSRQYDEAAGRVGGQGGDAALGHGDPHPGDMVAAGMAQQQAAGERGPQQQEQGPAKADRRRHRSEGQELEHRQ